ADELALPGKVRILPDVADFMDRGQSLGIIAAHRALASLAGWEKLREDVGIVLGVEGKTGRGIDANLRIFRDHVLRRVAQEERLAPATRERLGEVVGTELGKLVPSGPYTLLGLMPNVISGRVANAFDIKGPNLVVDAHRASLSMALAEA